MTAQVQLWPHFYQNLLMLLGEGAVSSLWRASSHPPHSTQARRQHRGHAEQVTGTNQGLKMHQICPPADHKPQPNVLLW